MRGKFGYECGNLIRNFFIPKLKKKNKTEFHPPPELKSAAKLKKEFYVAWLANGLPEAVDSDQEEFTETMDRDLCS